MVVVACFLGALGFILLGDARALPVQTVTVLLLWGFAAQLMTKPKASLTWLILVAVGLRALICFSNPTLSDDVYRYLWEGKSLWEGVNPYVVSVSESSHLDGIGQQVNHPQVTSVYPPIAMYVFALAAKLLYKPLIMQFIASVADVCIVFLIS